MYYSISIYCRKDILSNNIVKTITLILPSICPFFCFGNSFIAPVVQSLPLAEVVCVGEGWLCLQQIISIPNS